MPKIPASERPQRAIKPSARLVDINNSEEPSISSHRQLAPATQASQQVRAVKVTVMQPSTMSQVLFAPSSLPPSTPSGPGTSLLPSTAPPTHEGRVPPKLVPNLALDAQISNASSENRNTLSKKLCTMTVEDCEEDKELEASKVNPAKRSRLSNGEYTWLSMMQFVNIDCKYLILDDCNEHEMYTYIVVQDISDTVAEEQQ